MKATLAGRKIDLKPCPVCRGLLRYDKHTRLRILCGECFGRGVVVTDWKEQP
jgi:hypothetical protein